MHNRARHKFVKGNIKEHVWHKAAVIVDRGVYSDAGKRATIFSRGRPAYHCLRHAKHRLLLPSRLGGGRGAGVFWSGGAQWAKSEDWKHAVVSYWLVPFHTGSRVDTRSLPLACNQWQAYSVLRMCSGSAPSSAMLPKLRMLCLAISRELPLRHLVALTFRALWKVIP